MIGTIKTVLQTQGAGGLLRAVGRRLVAARATGFRDCESMIRSGIALEIGGPSRIFSRGGLVPAYPVLDRVDNCNYSARTIWEGSIEAGRTFRFDRARAPGQQFIAEACDLGFVPDETYDVVLSSHTIEHTANPLRALVEWRRVLKESGLLIMIVPHKESTFDHRRPVTPLAHLIDDERRGTAEDDTTHLSEILALHDHARDPGAGGPESFRERSARNVEHRCLHHHVFDTDAVARLMDHLGWCIKAVEPRRPVHILVIAQKAPAGVHPVNELFTGALATYRRSSPFASDRTNGTANAG